eukprot:2807046-Karenia_brevis.AAC.1
MGVAAQKVFVTGRVHRVSFTSFGIQFILWNIHNENISEKDFQSIREALEGDRKLAQDKPLETFLLTGGDFNCNAFDENKTYLRGPMDAAFADM